ncbi:MAG: PAS domain-containing protein [Rhodobacterales bacterium]|nr:PAS domain-containing protein [Rhodobacterales bacterium]
MTLSFLERFRAQRDLPQTPLFEGLPQVRAYWEGLRLNGQLPDRAALDPRGLGGMLDRVFLADRIGRGLVQIRVAGSGLAAFAGADVRGLPLSCLFASDSRPLLAQVLEDIFDTPAVAEIDLGSDRRGGTALLARMILLPLADRSGQKLVLGAISFAEGAAPCKLQIRARRAETLDISTVQAAKVPVPQPIRRYGHLALVHTSA